AARWGESYFDPEAMQQDTEHYRLMVTALEARWGAGVRGLFEQAWHSETLADCATFGEWQVVLPQRVPTSGRPVSVAQPRRPTPDIAPTLGPATEQTSVSTVHLAPADTSRRPAAGGSPVRSLLDAARQLELRGNRAGALDIYRQVQVLAPAGSGLSQELALIVQQLEAHLATEVNRLPTAAVASDTPTDPAAPVAADVELATRRRGVPSRWVLIGLLALVPV